MNSPHAATLSPYSYEGREEEGLQVHRENDAPEVDSQGIELWHSDAAPEVSQGSAGLEVYQDRNTGEEIHANQSEAPLMDTKEPLNAAEQPLYAADRPSYAAEERRAKRTCGMPTKWFYIVLAFVALVVIAVAVGAGVGATRHSQNSSSTSSSNLINSNSTLAAVAYQDVNNITQSRLYYQDGDGILKESAWNATSGTWYVSNSAIVSAKIGTPIAATAFTGASRTTLNVFYFEGDNNTISQVTSTDGGIEWKVPDNLPSAVSRQADEDSKLAAAVTGHYNCSDCTNNTILAFQSSSKLAVANISSADGTWDFNDTGLGAAPVAGTALSLFYFSDNQLRLWFQGQQQELHFYAWPVANGTVWTDRGSLAQDLAPSSPIAGFCYFYGGTTVPDFYQVLYFQTETTPPLNVTGWSDIPNLNQWTAAYSPPDLQQLTSESTLLAATEARRVYTLVNGTITEWEIDSTEAYIWASWNKLGTVPTT